MRRQLAIAHEWGRVALGAYRLRREFAVRLASQPLPEALSLLEPAGTLRWLSARQILTAIRWGLRLPTRGPKSTCLIRAVTLGRFLREAGEDVTLVIGVRREPPGELEAHAWLERPLGDPVAETPCDGDYQVIYRYPPSDADSAMPPSLASLPLR